MPHIAEDSGAGRPVCVVTGATGLVGTHLLARLAVTHEVVALARRPGAPVPGVTYHTCDLARPDFTCGLPHRADAVVHLAQSRAFRDFPAGSTDMLAINVNATNQLLQWAAQAGVRHAVIASSGAVYRPALTAMHEDDALHAPAECDFYAATRLAAESIAGSYRRLLPVSVLRFFFIYGAGQERSMLMPRLVDRVRAGEMITLDGENGMAFTPTHASDAAGAVLGALRLSEPATINVRGPDVLTLRDVCTAIGHAVGVAPRFDIRDHSPTHFIASDDRMRALLPAAAVSFTDGITSIT